MLIISVSFVLYVGLSRLFRYFPKCSRGHHHDWIIFAIGNGYDWDEYRCVHCRKEYEPCRVKPFQNQLDSSKALLDCKIFGHFWSPALIDGKLSKEKCQCGSCFKIKNLTIPWEIIHKH